MSKITQLLSQENFGCTLANYPLTTEENQQIIFCSSPPFYFALYSQAVQSVTLVYSAPIQLSVTQHETSMGIEESHPQDSALKQDRPAMSLCVTAVSCSDSNATLAK